MKDQKRTRKQAEILKCEMENYAEQIANISETPAVDIGIVPNPRFQNSVERQRDAPRLRMLQNLQKIVDKRGINDFEGLKKAKEEEEAVQGIIKMLKSGRNSPVEIKKEDLELQEPAAKKAKKTRKAIEREVLPRLVRRNARRGSAAKDGETWSEQVIMM